MMACFLQIHDRHPSIEEATGSVDASSGGKARYVKVQATAGDLGGRSPALHVVEMRCGTNRALRLRSLGVSLFLLLPTALAGFLLLTPHVRAWFTTRGLRWAYVFATAFTLSFCLTPLAAGLARRLGILDLPDARKLHPQATPLLGGAAIFVGFISALAANGILSAELIAILSGSMILFIVGVFDDWHEMPASLKLFIQVICTAMVMTAGIVLRVLPEDWGTWGRLGNLLLTVVWIIGITNALNFFDGMDGLAAGLGSIIAFLLAAVAFQTDQPILGWMALAVMGSCLGFLPYNFKRKEAAFIFLGDAGSTVVGFVLACIAVYGDWAEGRPLVALVSPVLIFWILIFDMAHITVDRIATGKVQSLREWIEFVGRDHLHHRLADALGSRRKSVLFIYLMALGLGISALMLRDAGTVAAVLLILQASIMVGLITILEHRGRRLTAVAVAPAAWVPASSAAESEAPSSRRREPFSPNPQGKENFSGL
jgi:UDP-GlcNAc:undecaprenyl-phosphate GlcNAc-1-phosphate transferase